MEVNLTHGPVLLLEIRNGFRIRASTEIKEIEIPRSESNEEDMALGRMLGQAHGPWQLVQVIQRLNRLIPLSP